MSFVGDVVGGLVGDVFGGDDANQAAREGAQVTAGAQREALEYIKEREELPQKFREGALGVLGGLYGLDGMNPQDALAKITGSAAYKNVLGARDAGEEAILRTAAATGGLRSGNTIDATARYAGELERQAFSEGLRGLQGLAMLPSNANQIANLTAGIGQTIGQGITAGGQAEAAARGAGLSAIIGGATGAFSDSRLKDNVKRVGTKSGLPWYTWTWNTEAAKFGLFGDDEGVMAHEVAELKPEAVQVKDNYLTVDYSALGV